MEVMYTCSEEVMSAAKMVADSTQSDEPATKIQKTKLTSKKNKKGKKETEKKNSKKRVIKEENSDPNLDLSKDIRAIGDYCKNRSEMLDEMFNSVQSSSLTMILPEILMDMDLKELKSLCLEHLEVMSKKRILKILAGDDPDTISSSGTEDEATDDIGGRQPADSTSEPDNNKNITDETGGNLVQQNTTDKDVRSKLIDDSPRNTQDDILTLGDDDEAVLELTTRTVTDNEKMASDNIEWENSNDSEEGDCIFMKTDDSESGSLIPMLTQNHMELLELEMRARAIKAMLKAQESHQSEPSTPM